MNPSSTGAGAQLLSSLDALVACEHFADLADRTAGLALDLMPGREVAVVLRDGGGAIVSGRSNASPELQQWAEGFLDQSGSGNPLPSQPYLVQIIRSSQEQLVGVIAAAESESADPTTTQTLEGLCRLAATRAAQIEGKARTSAELQGTKSALGKGLHDLRTPLNSLRLGLHLLEPALAGHDAAIMQRAQRAIDRMATLVSEMFESLNRNTSAQ